MSVADAELQVAAGNANATAGKLPVADAELAAACAIVIGAEGRGVRPEIAALATGVKIPTVNVESLNAAVAAGIFLYEARRQRQLS